MVSDTRRVRKAPRALAGNDHLRKSASSLSKGGKPARKKISHSARVLTVWKAHPQAHTYTPFFHNPRSRTGSYLAMDQRFCTFGA